MHRKTEKIHRVTPGRQDKDALSLSWKCFNLSEAKAQRDFHHGDRRPWWQLSHTWWWRQTCAVFEHFHPLAERDQQKHENLLRTCGLSANICNTVWLLHFAFLSMQCLKGQIGCLNTRKSNPAEMQNQIHSDKHSDLHLHYYRKGKCLSGNVFWLQGTIHRVEWDQFVMLTLPIPLSLCLL